MRCECCGEKHRDIHWLAGWLEIAAHLKAGHTNLSDESVVAINERQQEYALAYSCLYDESIGGGE